jgi:hypothetical protein
MSTTHQRRRSRERFWRQLLGQWRRSGLSVRDFCAEQQVSEPSFYSWRRAIALRDAEAARFVGVHVIPDEQPPTGATGSGSGLELVLGPGRLLRIGPGFDAATLKRLLALLEGRP